MTTQNTLPEPQPRAVRRARAKWWAIVGILFGMLGFLLLSLGDRERQRINEIPFEAPLKLVPGESVRGQFQADTARPYRVGLRFRDPASLTRVGAPDSFNEWLDWIAKRLTLHTTITAPGGNIIGLGFTSCRGIGSGGGETTCFAGYVNPEAGQTYALATEVTRAAPEMRALDARLVVVLGPEGVNSHHARVAVFYLLGLIAWGASLVMFVASLVAYIRKRRVMRSNSTA